jgi:hypothetical protein
VHNDTKVNNVLLSETGRATVLDLDTVMPGSLLFDFGDAVRSGASTRPEGSVDFENFTVDIPRYEAFLKGFLKGIRGMLTPNEVKLLPFSMFVLAYELGVRFLTDYLKGDVYFHTSYPLENLDRALGQLTLAKSVFFRLDELAKLSGSLGSRHAYLSTKVSSSLGISSKKCEDFLSYLCVCLSLFSFLGRSLVLSLLVGFVHLGDCCGCVCNLCVGDNAICDVGVEFSVSHIGPLSPTLR